MSQQVRKDIVGVLKGLQKVASEGVRLQENYAKHIWANSSIKVALDDTSKEITKKFREPTNSVDNLANEGIQRTSMILEGVKAFTLYLTNLNKQPATGKQGEISLLEYNALEFDPNKPLEGVPGFERDINKPSQLSKSLELELNTFISEAGVLTGKAVLKSNDLDQQKYGAKIQRDGTGIKPSNVIDIPERKIMKTSETFLDAPIKSSHAVPAKSALAEKSVAPSTPEETKKFKHSLSKTARERRVPASRIGRMISFGGLAAGLGIGTVAEAARRTLGLDTSTNSSLFVTPANAERIVSTLCKVRGAALKIGQLLSIQDNNVIDPTLQKAFERVRQSADFMPHTQVEAVLREELGNDWRLKFSEFEMSPFAAASIGQVHMGRLPEGNYVAVKVQYPGVAKGIDSDIENLVSVMNLWNVFPEGLFVDKMVEVAKKELAWEVDYIREAECTRKFRRLVEPYHDYYVPKVYDDLCTARIFTSELIEGVPVDKCADMDEKTRKHICTLIMKLCLKELFEWRYMQTDPNWSNFFYNADTRKLILLDFGATRSYDKIFMDKYIEVVKAGADNNRQKVLELSRNMGFLTGYESKAMENAHIDTVMILSEQFRADVGAFDFGRQDATARVTRLVPTILNHRLCPPPEEIYSLHRKLSGIYLLFAKLNLKMNLREMFLEAYGKYWMKTN